MRTLLIAVTVLLLATPLFGAVDQGSVFGVWLTEEGNSRLEIFPCGAKACAKVIWMSSPIYLNGRDGPVGTEKVDRRNPDPALRSRSILGLQVMEGFTREEGWWNGGSCYDPQSGRNYQCKMRLESPAELKLRGFIGFSLIGRSYTLTREPSGQVRTAQNREPGTGLH